MKRIKKWVGLIFALSVLSTTILNTFGTEKVAAVVYAPSDGSDSFTMDAQFFNRAYWELFSITFTKTAIDKGWIDGDYVRKVGSNNRGLDPTDNGLTIINNYLAQQVSQTNRLYFDEKPFIGGVQDDQKHYVHDYQGCDSVFENEDNKWQVTNLSLAIPGSGSDCHNILKKDIELPGFAPGDVNDVAYSILFSYKNSNTVVRVDGRDGDFVQSNPEAFPGRFFRVGDNDDYVDITPHDGSALDTANYYTSGTSRGTYSVQGKENATKPPTEVDENGNVVPGQGDDSKIGPDCYSGLRSSLSWLMCPVLGFIDDFIDWAESAISKQLTVDLGTADTRAKLQVAWTTVARFSSAILVIIALFMIISTALGTDLISSYTVKKVLPRLVIGAIGIWLSWALVSTYIDIMNDLGRGIAGIIISPFGDAKTFNLQYLAGLAGSNAGTGNAAIFTTLAIGGIVTAGIFGILGMALSALFAFIIAIIVLALRQAVIIFLVILAPLGIAMWILPNTQNLWKLWSGTLNKLLLMFPMIMGLLAAGKIFGYITAVSISSNESNPEKFFAFTISLIAYVAPYFLLPTLFKAAGGLFSNLTGMVNNKGKGIFDKMRGGLDAKQKARQAFKDQMGKERLIRRASKPTADNLVGNTLGKGWRSFNRSRLRVQGGQPLTGGVRPGVRNRAAAGLEGANAAVQKKEAEEAGLLLDAGARRAVQEYTASHPAATPDQLNDEKIKYLEQQALSGRGTPTRQAALDKLLENSEINKVAGVASAWQATAAGKADWSAAVSRNFSTIKEKAPDLVGFDLHKIAGTDLSKLDKTRLSMWQKQFSDAITAYQANPRASSPALRETVQLFLNQVNTNSRFPAQGAFGDRINIIKNGIAADPAKGIVGAPAAPTQVLDVLNSDGKQMVAFHPITGAVENRPTI